MTVADRSPPGYPGGTPQPFANMIIATTPDAEWHLKPSTLVHGPVRVVVAATLADVATDLETGRCDTGFLPRNAEHDPTIREFSAVVALRPTVSVWMADSGRWTLVAVGARAGMRSGRPVSVDPSLGAIRRVWMHAWARHLSHALVGKTGTHDAAIPTFMERLFLAGFRSYHVGELANRVDFTKKALGQLLRRRGWPLPKRFILAGRAFRTWESVRAGHDSLEDIAEDVGLSSGSALTHSIDTFLGVEPTTLRWMDPASLTAKIVRSLADQGSSGEKGQIAAQDP